MLDDEIVFDIETCRAFSEVGGRYDFANLGVSMVGVYSYGSKDYLSFDEHELHEFEEVLKQARRVIGFNIKHFDYQVLEPHLKSVRTKSLPTLDLMEEVAGVLGFRPKLNDLAKATLGVSKSGHGLEAIRWYKEGDIEKLRQYCLDDVKITKDLYEFGAREGYLKIAARFGEVIRNFPVSWERADRAEVQEPRLF